MIANVEKVIEWLENNATPHFVVYSSKNENSKIFESNEDDNFEETKARFLRQMELCTSNRPFTIKARKDYKSTRGMFQDDFHNNPEGSALNAGQSAISGTPQNVAPGVGYVAIGELERRLSEERKSIMQDVKIERLEAENKELQTELLEKDNALNRAIQKLEPYLGTILGNTVGKMLPQAPVVAVAGIENSEDTELEECDEQTRLANALQRWANVEPDMIRIIETLADMAERKDITYSFAKEKLLK